MKTVLGNELKRVVLTKATTVSQEDSQFYIEHGIEQAILTVSDVGDHIKVFGNENELVD